MKNTLETLESRQLMTTFTVTNPNDTGAGSLRDAITQANATAGADTVNFAIGSGAVDIAISSSMSVTNPLTIDGTTQPGYAGSPVVRITNAGSAGSALYINAAGSVVRGLSITGMGTAANPNDGTAISVAKQNVTIENNYIGIAPAGTAAGNQNDGIGLGTDADGAIIRNNVIGANAGDGIRVYGDNVIIQGNKIGTDPTGSVARGNVGNGVENVGVIGMLVGGPNPIDGNVISGNGKDGILFANLNAKGEIYNNTIGLSVVGNTKLANANYGIHLFATSGVIVGDYTKGNHIGGNGILVDGNASANKILYNSIGFGTIPFFDVGDTYGIDLAAANNTIVKFNTVGRCFAGIRVIGGHNELYANYSGVTDAGIAIGNTTGFIINGSWNRLLVNSAANNSSVGVHIQTGDQNSVDDNHLWANGQSLKIEPGANGDFIVPEIQSVTQNPNTGEWTVNTFMDVPAGLGYTLSYYVSDTAGLASSGHTQKWLGSISSTGSAAYEPVTKNFPASTLQDGRYLTLTLSKTYLNNGISSLGATSEPSPALQLVGLPSVYSSKFEYETGHSWSFTFSDDISASLAANDLSIRNVVTNAIYSANSVTWNAATRTARFARSTPLPDGKYVASIKTTSVSNAYGANIENFPLNFNFRKGDANNDGLINFADLLIVAQNYGTTGKTFSQGDFNYDGNVNFSDLLIVAQKYGTSLFSSQPITETRTRVIDQLA